MARTITELGRVDAGASRSGRAQDGSVKNNKVVVWGKMNVTSYTTGGEVVAPKDLGLANLDYITFDVRTVNNAATEPAIAATLKADYITSTNKVLITADTASETQVTSLQAAVLFYLAAGDQIMSDLT